MTIPSKFGARSLAFGKQDGETPAVVPVPVFAIYPARLNSAFKLYAATGRDPQFRLIPLDKAFP